MNELKNEMKIDIYSDEIEWNAWNKRGDSVIHIELRKWADIVIIAPLSANSLAKISNGICDNLLTSIIRAWDFNHHHVIIAPAMNTIMWHNPFTQIQLNKLKQMFDDKIHILQPISKKLMCNDIGKGAMAKPQTIVKLTKDILYNNKQINNKYTFKKIDTGLIVFGFICLTLFIFKDTSKRDKT